MLFIDGKGRNFLKAVTVNSTPKQEIQTPIEEAEFQNNENPFEELLKYIKHDIKKGGDFFK